MYLSVMFEGAKEKLVWRCGKFANVFAQFQAIVYGPAPTLPPGYSADAQDFVAKWSVPLSAEQLLNL